MSSTYLLSPVQQAIEKAKDYVEATDIITEQRLKLQGLLSVIRTEVNLIEKRLLESEMRQNIYANLTEKILNTLIETKSL